MTNVEPTTTPPERWRNLSDKALSAARSWRQGFEKTYPAIAKRPRRKHHMRGIEAYPDEPTLLRTLAIALEVHYRRHGRIPAAPKVSRLADGFFVEKFYGDFPIRQNPADKLNAELWLPEALKEDARIAERPWVSDVPVLPPDDAVPPGAWILKLALGNATNKRLVWPPSAEERQRLDAEAANWFKGRYGVIWGEWWYAVGGQRLFLEQDLTEARAGQPEFKLYTRGGRVVAIRGVLHRKEQGLPTAERFYDAEFRPMEGQSEGYDPLTMDPPISGARMIRAAEGIGRAFDRVRVDFLHTGEERPWLNEITFGDVNAQRRVTPPALERRLMQLLFG